MADERDRVPMIYQAALAATPLLFIGLPAWMLVIILKLFDIDAAFEVGVVMACVLPIALFLFARLCAKHNLIRPDASPLAIAVLQSAAAAFVVWLQPRLPALGSGVGPGGRDQGSVAGFLMAAVIFVAGWIALALFSSNEIRQAPESQGGPLPRQDDPAARSRRFPQ